MLKTVKRGNLLVFESRYIPPNNTPIIGPIMEKPKEKAIEKAYSFFEVLLFTIFYYTPSFAINETML